MRPVEILCGGIVANRRNGCALELDTSANADPQKRIVIKLDDWSRKLVNVAPIFRDAIEVASYVWMADRLIRRGTDQMSGMGAEWRRTLNFKIPVRCKEVWETPAVTTALIETLNFLSEDLFSFEFHSLDLETPLDPYLDYGFQTPEIQSEEEVVLFSGGLDSLAGAVSEIVGRQRRAILVTHKSSTTIAGRQDRLVEQLKRFADPGRIFYAPIWVQKGGPEPTEHTQRTRSFLFASLGVALANVFQKDTIHFFENGITSYNLPIAEHVVGTRASRTTHPRVLAMLSDFFSLLVQRQVRIENPFLWMTKADVVSVLGKHGCPDLIAQTISCARVRNFSMTGKQCGVCSQCIERRFGILGADLDAFEPPDNYELDLFTGAHEKIEDITLVEQHVSRAERLSKMTEQAFLGAYGQVFRTLPYISGTRAAVATRIYDLHRRYGEGIIAIVNQRLRSHAHLEGALTLPPTSLLAMVNSPVGLIPPLKDATETAARASVQANADASSAQTRRFVFAIDEERREVLFTDGPKLDRQNFHFFRRLAVHFRNYAKCKGALDAYEYVPTRTLMHDLSITEHTVAQRVHRIRRTLSEQFERAIDYTIDEQDVIQSFRWQGFRLNPYLVEIPMSDLQPPSVITPRQVVRTRRGALDT